jgi:hypothetical protein
MPNERSILSTSGPRLLPPLSVIPSRFLAAWIAVLIASSLAAAGEGDGLGHLLRALEGGSVDRHARQQPRAEKNAAAAAGVLEEGRDLLPADGLVITGLVESGFGARRRAGARRGRTGGRVPRRRGTAAALTEQGQRVAMLLLVAPAVLSGGTLHVRGELVGRLAAVMLRELLKETVDARTQVRDA